MRNDCRVFLKGIRHDWICILERSFKQRWTFNWVRLEWRKGRTLLEKPNSAFCHILAVQAVESKNLNQDIRTRSGCLEWKCLAFAIHLKEANEGRENLVSDLDDSGKGILPLALWQWPQQYWPPRALPHQLPLFIPVTPLSQSETLPYQEAKLCGVPTLHQSTCKLAGEVQSKVKTWFPPPQTPSGLVKEHQALSELKPFPLEVAMPIICMNNLSRKDVIRDTWQARDPLEPQYGAAGPHQRYLFWKEPRLWRESSEQSGSLMQYSHGGLRDSTSFHSFSK